MSSSRTRMVGAGGHGRPLAVAARWQLTRLSRAAQRAAPRRRRRKGEWRTYGADLASTRYSPLDQINAGELQQAGGGVAVQDRQPRPAPRIQLPVHAADGRRRALHDRRHAARRGGAGRGHRRAAVDAPRGRRQARRGSAAAAVGTRPVLLDRRPHGPDPLRHARLPHGGARRARPASSGAVLRQGRRGRPEARGRPGDGPGDRATSACTRRRIIVKDIDHHRRGAHRGQPAGEPPQRQGLRARLRRAHRQAACGSSTPFRGPASTATTPGSRARRNTPATPACGRR